MRLRSAGRTAGSRPRSCASMRTAKLPSGSLWALISLASAGQLRDTRAAGRSGRRARGPVLARARALQEGQRLVGPDVEAEHRRAGHRVHLRAPSGARRSRRRGPAPAHPRARPTRGRGTRASCGWRSRSSWRCRAARAGASARASAPGSACRREAARASRATARARGAGSQRRRGHRAPLSRPSARAGAATTASIGARRSATAARARTRARISREQTGTLEDVRRRSGGSPAGPRWVAQSCAGASISTRPRSSSAQQSSQTSRRTTQHVLAV